ncbi:MAG: hypothetical protein AAF902_05490, partial [Chloroflexota bacterium]
MQPLKKALQDHELVVLRIIGEWWEIDLTGKNKKACISVLSAELPQLELAFELPYLPAEEIEAVKSLLKAKGRMSRATFVRQFGDVRQMGPGAMEREEPWLDPQSSAEDLWYRGLIYFGIDRDDPSSEFVYMPSEFVEKLDLAQLEEGESDEDGDYGEPIEHVEGPESNAEDVAVPDALEKKKTNLKGIGKSIPAALLQGIVTQMPEPVEPKKPDPEPEPEPKKKAAPKKRKKPIQIKKPPKKNVVSEEPELVDDDEMPPEFIEDPDEVEKESGGIPRVPLEELDPEPEPEWATRPVGNQKQSVERSPAPISNRPKRSAPTKKSSQASAGDPEKWTPAATSAVDDFVTLMTLAQTNRLKNGQTEQVLPYLINKDPNRLNLLISIGVALAFLKRSEDGFRPSKAAVDWLHKGREGQLQELANGWLVCGWNGLKHVPTLSCEGSNWSNSPEQARKALLDAITLDPNWRPHSEVVERIKKENPDFQRPNGNYDIWYIRDLATGEYVSGFENWDLVEGRLLRFLIEQPLNWLGLADVGAGVYRLTERAIAWINEDTVAEVEAAEGLSLSNNGLLIMPPSVDRYKRFQAGRFAELEPTTPDEPF